MSEQEAYRSSFRKTAEEHGIPPCVLTKVALLTPFDVAKGLVSVPQYAGNALHKAKRILDDVRTYQVYANRIKPHLDKIPGKTPDEKVQNAATYLDTMLSVGKGLTHIKNFFSDITGNLSKFYNGLSTNQRRALIGSLAAGATGLLFSGGGTGRRITNGLGMGALGALGGYGLSRSGMYDNARNYLTHMYANKAGVPK